MDLFGGDSCSTESDEGDLCASEVPPASVAEEIPAAVIAAAAVRSTAWSSPTAEDAASDSDNDDDGGFDAVTLPLHVEFNGVATATTHHTLRTEFPPCAIECLHLRDWAALSSGPPPPSLVACGTYKLIEADEASTAVAAEARREGKLMLFSSVAVAAAKVVAAAAEEEEEGGGGGASSLLGGLELHAVADTSAILDLKWVQLPSAGAGIITACADGTLRTWSVDAASSSVASASLALASECACVDASTLCLAVDWSERSAARDAVASSHSDGTLSLARLAPEGLVLERNWAAHAHGGAQIAGRAAEVWTVAFGRCGAAANEVLFSGAEDATLKLWDLRGASLVKATRAGSFDAGVTSLAPHPTAEHVIAVGSYDGNVRLWDTRQLRAPTAVHPVGGGVWRLKWHPDPSVPLLLAACMRGGCRVLSCAPDASSAASSSGASSASSSARCWSIRGAATYAEHGDDALAYGIDWVAVTPPGERPSGGGGWGATVCSCSFYEHSVRVWSASSLV